MTRSSCLAALVVALPAVACSYSLNYPPDGPRYAVPAAPAAAPTEDASRLRVVTFNVKFARDVDGAIATLREEPALREADVILLQEMDASGAYRIATTLGHAFVCYPGALHGRSGRQSATPSCRAGPSPTMPRSSCRTSAVGSVRPPSRSRQPFR